MYENDFNLDDILSEFSDAPSPAKERPTASEERSRRSAAAEELISEQRSRKASYSSQGDSVRKPSRNTERQTPTEYEKSAAVRRTVPSVSQEPRNKSASPERRKRKAPADIMDVSLSPKNRSKQREKTDRFEEPARRSSGVSAAAKLFGGIVFLAAVLAFSLWLLVNVHPNTATVKTENVRQEANLSSRFENLVNNLASDALSDIVYIKKVYSIPEDASVPPKPSQACYGESNDPAVIQSVIDSASELLNGQKMVWSPGIETYGNTPVQYYCDDTILSLVWKEVVGNTVFTFAEVKIADGSQLRRFLSDDVYGSEHQYYASDMAATVNAVTAMNGDFYGFRQMGIVVFRRSLERFEPNRLDTCFFTSAGEMMFAHQGEFKSEEETRKFIEENDIVFSTAFGPILVENGELRKVSPDYPVGEVSTKYARSAIGITDELHYLLMATSSEKNSGYLAGVYVSEAGHIMFDKGCIMAYELDGGQTAVIIHNNKPANEIVYGSERLMTDIIYFATAIPNGEG